MPAIDDEVLAYDARVVELNAGFDNLIDRLQSGQQDHEARLAAVTDISKELGTRIDGAVEEARSRVTDAIDEIRALETTLEDFAGEVTAIGERLLEAVTEARQEIEAACEPVPEDSGRMQTQLVELHTSIGQRLDNVNEKTVAAEQELRATSEAKLAEKVTATEEASSTFAQEIAGRIVEELNSGSHRLHDSLEQQGAESTEKFSQNAEERKQRLGEMLDILSEKTDGDMKQLIETVQQANEVFEAISELVEQVTEVTTTTMDAMSAGTAATGSGVTLAVATIDNCIEVFEDVL